MKKFFLTFVVTAVLIGCGGPKPPAEGYVRDRRVVAAHWRGGWDSRTVMRYKCTTKTEYDHFSERTETRTECGNEPTTELVWEDHYEWVDDDWQFFLEDCEQPEGDKEPKCKTGWRSVDESEYDKFPIGTHYPTHIEERHG